MRNLKAQDGEDVDVLHGRSNYQATPIERISRICYAAYDMRQILCVSKVFPKTSIWNWCPRPLNSGHGSADFKKFYHALQKSTEIYFQSFIYTQEYSISRKKELIMIPRCWNIWCIDQPWIQLIIRKLFPASFSFPFHSPILKPYFHLNLVLNWIEHWLGCPREHFLAINSDSVPLRS